VYITSAVLAAPTEQQRAHAADAVGDEADTATELMPKPDASRSISAPRADAVSEIAQ